MNVGTSAGQTFATLIVFACLVVVILWGLLADDLGDDRRREAEQERRAMRRYLERRERERQALAERDGPTWRR